MAKSVAARDGWSALPGPHAGPALLTVMCPAERHPRPPVGLTREGLGIGRRSTKAVPWPRPPQALSPPLGLRPQAVHAGLTQAPGGGRVWGEPRALQRTGRSCFTACPGLPPGPSHTDLFLPKARNKISPADMCPLWSPCFLCSGRGSPMWAALPPGSPSRLTGRENTRGALERQRSQSCHRADPVHSPRGEHLAAWGEAGL